MAIVVLKLPNVKRENLGRPRQCPDCEGVTFQRWGQVPRPVRDVRRRTVRMYRYRCCDCRRAFRHYPGGSSRADQAERLMCFAVIGGTLGLSHRTVSRLILRDNL